MRKHQAPLLATALCVLVGMATTASATEVWSVDSGRTTLYLNQDVLAKAGLSVTAAGEPASQIEFSVSPAELFLSESTDAAVSDAIAANPLRHTGTLSFHTANGRQVGAGFSLSENDSMLVGGERSVHVDTNAGTAFVDISAIAISGALASAIGDASLEGLVVGRAQSEMAITYRRGTESIEMPEFSGDMQYLGTTPCMGAFGPDVIVGDLYGMGNYPAVGGIEAYSVATESCNMGTQNLLWQSQNPNHPVIAQNMYRLKTLPNGVTQMEQIGVGWLKHGFTALTLNLCCSCSGQGGSVLGVGCSDPYSSGLNGQQGWPSGGLGPRFEVNAHTGGFPYPYTFRGATGNGIYKRLQVQISDLDNSQNGGGLYFVEGHYIANDDAAAGNANNNASYRRINIAQGSWTASLAGSTQREQQAIRAWKDNDATVHEVEVNTVEVDTNKALLILASDVTDLGGGMWHYEYAVYNMNSDRSIGSVSIPVDDGVNVSNVGYHDVFYHSGDGFGSTSASPVTYEGTDWGSSHASNQLTWATADFNSNPNANAIRWGTTYNFRFDADQPPTSGDVFLGYYKPGPLTGVGVTTNVPSAPIVIVDGDLDGDGDVDLADFAIFQQCFGGSFNPPGVGCPAGIDADFDGDGDVDLADFAVLTQNFTGTL